MAKPPLPEKVLKILARPNPAVIATVQPDGAPVSVATWYLLEDDGRVLLNLTAGQKRMEYLRNDPRVSLTVLDGDGSRGHVSLQGKIMEFRDDPDLKGIDRLSQHYVGKPKIGRSKPRISTWLTVETYHFWGALSSRGESG